MKRVAIVGSSGGNLYAQGGNNPPAMMREIFSQAGSAGIEIGCVLFIGASQSMDNISPNAKAKLYTLGEGNALAAGDEATLKEVNEEAAARDKELAELIQNKKIDGMILLSADPSNINQASLKAAAEKGIPIVGTGGTSMANTQKLGAKVISASGTTGTTNRTRAVAFVSAFASEWKLKYRPVIGTAAGGEQQGNIWKRINFRGIMMASLPGFIAMAICLALSKIPGLGALEDVFNQLIGVLPVLIAAIAAKQVSGLDEVGIVAGVVAGILSVGGGIIGGLIAGIIAGVLGKLKAHEIANAFIEGSKGAVAGAMIVGVARGVYWVLEAGHVNATIVYYTTELLKGTKPYTAALGIMILVTFINGLIPSGSGKAALLTPIIVPIAIQLGLTPQSAVLSYQFGDGITNMFWFSMGTLLIYLNYARAPLNKWYRFFVPLMVIFYIFAVIVLWVAIAVHY